MVEDATEVEPEGDEELIPDDGDGNANSQSLEEVLQCEAELRFWPQRYKSWKKAVNLTPQS